LEFNEETAAEAVQAEEFRRGVGVQRKRWGSGGPSWNRSRSPREVARSRKSEAVESRGGGEVSEVQGGGVQRRRWGPGGRRKKNRMRRERETRGGNKTPEQVSQESEKREEGPGFSHCGGRHDR
jgi:hypothetical protein